MCDRSGVRTLVGRGDVACRPWGVGPGIPACNRPMRGIRYGGCGIWPGNRKSLEVALQHRPHSHGTRCRPEAAVFAGGYPIGPEPNVVRIAPLHDAGIPLARKHQGGDGLLCGESYTLMHPRSPAPVIVRSALRAERTGGDVLALFSFVKLDPAAWHVRPAAATCAGVWSPRPAGSPTASWPSLQAPAPR